MYDGTQTVLGGNAVYTGRPRMSNRDDNVVGFVVANQTGTLHIQQSYDPLAADILTAGSANWDVDKTVSVLVNTPVVINEVLVAPYWRLTYTNGATPQTVFRLHARTWSGGDS